MKATCKREDRLPFSGDLPTEERSWRSDRPIPSTVTTVALASWSVRTCTMCATHSQTCLFVDKAHWNGAVAASDFLANCFAMVLATDLQMMSPTTISLTPPSGFANEVNRPTRMPSITSSSTPPTANFVPAPTTQNLPHSRGWRTSDGLALLLSWSTQTRKKILPIQLKSLHWFRSQNLLTQCMSAHKRTTNRVRQFSQCGHRSRCNVGVFWGLTCCRQLSHVHQIVCPVHALLNSLVLPLPGALSPCRKPTIPTIGLPETMGNALPLPSWRLSHLFGLNSNRRGAT